MTAAVGGKLGGDHRVMNLDTLQDAVQVVRTITELPPSLPMWRQQRPFLMAEAARLVSGSSASTSAPGEEPKVSLSIDGFVRALGISANQAVHVPGAGDFLMTHISAPEDPNAARRAKGEDATMGMDAGADGGPVLMDADPEEQESLQRENAFDPMEGDQPPITEARSSTAGP